jgi:Xaa-Pro aminopeptidase
LREDRREHGNALADDASAEQDHHVTTGGWAGFSEPEMRRRRSAVAAELDRAGVSHALVYGANRSGSAVSWLTGWPVTREALLIVGRAEVDWAGDAAIATAIGLLPPAVLADGVGVVGAVPFDQYARLAGAAGKVVNLNPAYTRLRLSKSPEEVAALRHAAALSDAAVDALRDSLRPGATDHEIVAAVERAYTVGGGLHHIHYVGITAMDPAVAAAKGAEPAVAVPAQWPTGRTVRAGDAVTCEISAAVAPEYAGQLLRTFVVGVPATPLYADLHAVADAAFDAMAAVLVPGTTGEELLEAAMGVITPAGFAAIDDLAHGFGGGYLPPVISAPGRTAPGTEPGDRKPAASEFVLSAGMTIVVQPNITTADGTAGVQTGELLLVTDHGPERLHDYPRGLRPAG